MDKETDSFPRIRPLMVFPISSVNGESICMKDPEGFSEASLVINSATYFMITLMDGTRSVPDIQAEFMRQAGTLIPAEQIERLIANLDQALFLDNPDFRHDRKKIESHFLNVKTRAPAHMGSAYPEDPKEFSSLFRTFFENRKDYAHGFQEPVAGIIAPHIDIRQAGSCYAAAYETLKTSSASTVIILGTAHSDIGKNRYAICPKDFETPLGLLPCDQERMNVLLDITGVDWTEGQLSHRTEHSVEFQTLFLRYLFPDREIRIIPVLCNTFADLLDDPQGPMGDDALSNFIQGLRQLVNDDPGDVALIAGADLSHMGPKFGHPEPLKETDLPSLNNFDMTLIHSIEAGEPETFFRTIQQDRDHHNVCGVPNIYTFLKVMEGKKGVLLDYGQYYEPTTASAVSYASLTF